MTTTLEMEQADRAGTVRRSAALVCDLVSLVVLAISVMAAEAYFHRTAPPTVAQHIRWSLVTQFLWLAFTSSEFVFAASPGKALLGLRIANGDGSPAATSTLFLRWTTKWSFLIIGAVALLTSAEILDWLASLMSLIVLIGCLAGLGDAGLTWHDRWARTIVVRVRRLSKQRGFEPVMK